jgi:hypothetical protein
MNLDPQLAQLESAQLISRADEDERGNGTQAEAYHAQARETIRYIAAYTSQQFRATFLNLPAVRAVVESR